MTFSIYLFALVCAVAYAEQCCFPRQFEGSIDFQRNRGEKRYSIAKGYQVGSRHRFGNNRRGGRWYRNEDDTDADFRTTFGKHDDELVKGVTRFSIDKDSLMMSTNTTFVFRDDEKQMRVVSHFNSGFIYFISEDEQRCFKKKTDIKPTWCVSDDFDLKNQYYLGIDSDRLIINTYVLEKDGRQAEISVTDQNECIPISTMGPRRRSSPRDVSVNRAWNYGYRKMSGRMFGKGNRRGDRMFGEDDRRGKKMFGKGNRRGDRMDGEDVRISYRMDGEDGRRSYRMFGEDGRRSYRMDGENGRRNYRMDGEDDRRGNKGGNNKKVFIDTTSGILDRSVFDVPAFCEEAPTISDDVGQMYQQTFSPEFLFSTD